MVVDTVPDDEEEEEEEEEEDVGGEEEEDSDGWQSEDDPEKLWCICRQPHNNRSAARPAGRGAGVKADLQASHTVGFLVCNKRVLYLFH